MEDVVKHLQSIVELQGQRLATQEALTSRLVTDINRMADKVDETMTSTHRIEVLLAGRKECTSPGLCLELRTRLDQMERTTHELLEARAEGRGVMRVAGAIYVLIGSSASALISYLISHHTKAP